MNKTDKLTQQEAFSENGIQVREVQVLAPTPTSILELAVKQNANVDTLAKLLELQERFEAGQARKAFDEAFAAFKAEAPRLEKTKSVSYGQGKTSYKYTPLDEIASALGPILARHGLSYSWEQSQDKETITVICILSHTLGHSRKNALSGPPDTSGSKNAIQAIAGGVSYLRRYTLLGVTGMATSDEDADGITMGNAADFIANMEAATTLQELQVRYREAINEGLKARDTKAVDAFIKARDKYQKAIEEKLRGAA